MADFDTITIEAATERIIDYRGKTPPKTNSGVRLVTAKVVKSGQILDDPAEYIASEFYDEWMRRGLPQKHDVLLTTEAPLGEVGILRDDERIALAQRIILLRAKPGLIDPHFLFYALQSDFGQGELRARASGTTVLGIKQSELRQVRIPLFPLVAQHRIGEILSAYDDFIENCQRRIQILETMARDLYREWFVNFRVPGHEATRVTNGVPNGWERVQLDRMINVIHGYAFQGSYFSDKPTSRVLTTPGNFRVGGGIKYDRLKFYSAEGPLDPAYVLEPMDLILTMTDLSKAGDTLGFPALVPRLSGLSFLHNQRIGKVVPVGDFFPKFFLYCLFCDERYRHYIVSGATGLSVKHTSPTRILSHTVVIPKHQQLLLKFENFARPVFQRIYPLIEQIHNLRQTRDLLLPRLLSGQVDLKRG